MHRACHRPPPVQVLVKAAEARGEKQAYLDAGDYEGVTALMRAVRSGTGETVKVRLLGRRVTFNLAACVAHVLHMCCAGCRAPR